MQNPVMQSPVTDPNYSFYLQQRAASEGPGDMTNTIGTGTSAGITSLSDALNYARDNYGTLASGALLGLGPSIIGSGIAGLVGNIRDPNTDFLGRLNDIGLSLQARNMAQARGLSKQAGLDAASRGISGFTGYGTSQERGAAMRGDGDGDGGSGPGNDGYGGNAGTADEGFI